MQDSLGLVVDTETTGLGEQDEIVEVALLLFAYDVETGDVRGILDRYSALREPNVPCGDGALRVHGITPEMTAGKRIYVARIVELFERAQIIFAHNADFDKRFLQRLCPDLPNRTWACTMRQIVWVWEGLISPSLDSVAAHYEINRPKAHRAHIDAITVLSVLRKRNCDGIRHVKQLHDRVHRAPHRLKFINTAHGTAMNLEVAFQDDELLARSADDFDVRLWTLPDYPYINGYLAGYVGGQGKVFQFEKEKRKNKNLLEMVMREDRRVDLHLLRRTDDELEFGIATRER